MGLTPAARRRWGVGAGVAVGGLIMGQVAGWIPPHPAAVFGALVVAGILTSVLTGPQFDVRRGAVMPPSFVITFLALLLHGPHAAAIVAAAAVLASPRGGQSRVRGPRHLLREVGTVVLATEAAGFTYVLSADALGFTGWPWHALPIAAAVTVYHVSLGALTHVVIPPLVREPIDRGWAKRALNGCPTYLLGGAIAAGLLTVISQQLWHVLPVAAAALLLAYRTYADYLVRIGEDDLRSQVAESLEQGISVVDADGIVTVWSDGLERLTGRTRAMAIGRPLQSLLPELVKTEVPRAITSVAADGKPRAIARVTLGSMQPARIVQAKVLPVADGVAIVWQDVTERVRAEIESRRTEDRLALAAEAANDGLWQWDLRSQEFYVSGRWCAMLGLPAQAGVVRPEAWLDRVHADDVAGLKAALEAHLSGQTDTFVHEHRIQHDDGTYRRYLCRGAGARTVGRRRDRIAGSLTDTTEQAIAQERLRSVGVLDALTGLLNRAIFVEDLGRRIEDFRQRRANGWFAVLYLDLDRFKIVNDSLGHLVGDELLIGVSRRLETCIRPGDALARLGGDEFAVLLNGLTGDEQANAIAHRIQQALSAPFSIGGREVFTSASIGISFGPGRYTSPGDMMRDADTAMYHAKARGKARHEMFDADMHARVRDRVSLETDLRRAVNANDFDVHYQPIVLLTTGMCVGFESLARWTRNGEPVSPVTFVPIAEELGLITPLGNWVLEKACMAFGEWQRKYPHAGLDYITVNVSSRQLMQPHFVRVVERAVEQAGMKSSDLRIEITETALLDNPGEAAAVLRELQNYGAKVYLDDFGTGYSSLSHLHKLPVDALKIDRSFVNSLSQPNRPAIVESILALARTLNTGVVAEGIETHLQAAELKRLGCTHAQGFLFSRPLPAAKAEEVVKAHRSLAPPAPEVLVGSNGWEAFDALADTTSRAADPRVGASL